MKRILFLTLLFLLASVCRAQGIRRDDIVLNAFGQPVPGATERVCSYPLTGTNPCTPLANVFQDFALTIPWPNNVVTADQFGNAYFFIAAPGSGVTFQLEFSGLGLQTHILDHVTLSGTGAPVVTTLQFNYTTFSFTPTPVFDISAHNAWAMTLSGNVTSSSVTGSPAIGDLISLRLCENGTGGFTFAFPGNFIPNLAPAFDTTPNACTNSLWIFDGANWYEAAATGGSLAVAGNVTITGNLTVDGTTNINNFGVNGNLALKGPDPWSDITNPSFGGVGDARQAFGGSMLATSQTLTCTDCAFVPGDVGKSVYVGWAIPGGPGVAGVPLVSTISSVADGTHANLAVAASSTTIAAQQVFIGTDNTAAFNAAIAWLCVGSASHSGGWVFVPPYQFLVLGTVLINDSTCPNNNVEKIHIEGSDRYASVVYGATNGDVFRFVSTTKPKSPTNREGPGIENLSIIGGDQPLGVGVHAGDLVDMHYEKLVIQNFRGISNGLSGGGTGAGMWLDNRTWWTEETYIGDVVIASNCTACTSIAFTVNGGTSSFGYTKILGLHYDTGTFYVGAGAGLYNSFLRMSGNSQNFNTAGNIVTSTVEITGEGTGTWTNTGIVEITGHIYNPGLTLPPPGNNFVIAQTGIHTEQTAQLYGSYQDSIVPRLIGVGDINLSAGAIGNALFGIADFNSGSKGNILAMFNAACTGRSGLRVLQGNNWGTANLMSSLDCSGLGDFQTLAIHSNVMPIITDYANKNGSYFIGGPYTGTRQVAWPDANVNFTGNGGAGGFAAFLKGATTLGNCANFDATGTNVANITDSGAPCTAALHSMEFFTGVCNNAGPTAGSSFDLPATNAAAPLCVRDSVNFTVQNVLTFADGATGFRTAFLPRYWHAFDDAVLLVTTIDTTAGHTIIFQLQTACVAPNTGVADTPAFNAAQQFATITIPGGAISGQLYSATIPVVTGTGCAANTLLHIALARITDTVTDTTVQMHGPLVINFH